MKVYFPAFAALLAMLIFAGCATAPRTEEGREALADSAQRTLKEMQAQDPSLQEFLDRGYGYAIFPSVGKGGFVAGGAYGRGLVYRGNEFVGYSDLTQASVGLQAGGQEFAELIVFENEQIFNRFTTSQFNLGANASAIALRTGAATTARFQDGTAIFVMPRGGLMVEASVSGQQFKFQPRQ